MRIVTLILRLYPPRWRERYQEEMLAVLEQHAISLFTLIDLLLSALDARLDPAYRTKGGFMSRRFRDPRSLSIIYLGLLTLSLFLVNFWRELADSFSAQGIPIRSANPNPTETLTNWLALFCTNTISCLCLVALCTFAGSLLYKAMKQRRFGTLIFAFVCLGFGIADVFPIFSSGLEGSLIDWILNRFHSFETMWFVGAGLFVTGIKGLQAARERQWWSLGLALVIDLLFPAVSISYSLLGMGVAMPGSSISISPGSLLIGYIIFPSMSGFLSYLLSQMAPYLLLGALLLALSSNKPDVPIWRVTRGFGTALTFALVANMVVTVIWNINWWNGAPIFDPARGLSLYGGQWVDSLIINALLLAVLVAALGFALFVFLRGFLARPETRHIDPSPLQNASYIEESSTEQDLLSHRTSHTASTESHEV